jgi:hypothetical protein
LGGAGDFKLATSGLLAADGRDLMSSGQAAAFCRREFLIVDFRLLNENRVPCEGVQPTINIH